MAVATALPADGGGAGGDPGGRRGAPPPPTAAPAASIACVALMVQFASKPSPMRDPSPVSLSVIRAASRASLCP